MTERERLYQKRDALVAQHHKVNADYLTKIAEIDRQIRRSSQRSPSKWDGASEEQRNYWHFMGFDPDDPDVPTD